MSGEKKKGVFGIAHQAAYTKLWQAINEYAAVANLEKTNPARKRAVAQVDMLLFTYSGAATFSLVEQVLTGGLKKKLTK